MAIWIPCLNISTTPITAMGCRQCLPLSVVQLKGKHCRKPRCRNGVVDMFRLCPILLTKVQNRFVQSEDKLHILLIYGIKQIDCCVYVLIVLKKFVSELKKLIMLFSSEETFFDITNRFIQQLSFIQSIQICLGWYTSHRF